ncbi:MAG: hypothetical protein GF400_08935 [Candidatus Eisenbacteria bacterium]|nr:hypothetical protein [Candidatus Eisenbacteria bacterium]
MAQSRTGLPSLAVAAFCAAILLPACAIASVTLLSYPQEMLSLTDRATVTWEEDVRCYLTYGPAPGVYTSRTTAEAVRELTFVPADEDIPPGLHFCVLHSTTGGEESEEFQIVVESPLFPEPVSPPNGGTVEGTTALLEWDPVDRVPYYHVVVSDSEIEISEEDGEIRLYGANIIWQAITSGTSIHYGGPDPSGHFDASNGVSPPLMDGFTYNWLVFNNYGNHPLLTSTAGAGIAGFTAPVEAAVEPPSLLEPADSISSAEDVLTFDWTDVPGCVGYHLYIHERRDWAGGEASYPVWDASTMLSEIDVHMGGHMPEGEYHWRVVALDEAGGGASSESRALHYETDTGEARIVTRGVSGEPLPWVYVEIEFTSGGVEVVPAVTNEEGVYNKDLIPGEYTFRATKEGHVDTLEQASIWVDETTPVELRLRRTPARVRGVVHDEAGRPVFDAEVTATRGSDETSTRTDADGNFVVSVTPGEWSFVGRKSGYEQSGAVDVVVAAGDYHEMEDPLVLLGIPGTISGTVVNSAGNPLPAATVRAERAGTSESVSTNGSGGFTLELAPGLWEVSAWKSGFQESEDREIDLPPGQNVSVDPPVVLSPVASSISGRVTDGRNAVAGATVVAVPECGEVFETVTNNYGEFLLVPGSSDYVLKAHSAGHAPSNPHHVSIDPHSAFTGVSLELRPLECAISGRVTDGAGPVPQATISNGELETVTGQDGSFAIETPPGVHDLLATKPGHFSGGSRRIALSPGQSLHGLSLTVIDGACSASGRVTCVGSPVPGALVRAEGPGGAAGCVTDGLGRYELALEAGEWTLFAGKNGFAACSTETLVLSEGQSVSGVGLSLVDESATVMGVVSDASGPVRRASIVVREAGSEDVVYRTSSSSTGGYRVRAAHGVAYSIRVSAPERGSVHVGILPLEPGETRVRDIALPTWRGLVSGSVHSGGESVRGARVTAVWGDSASVRTDRNGGYSLWLNDGLYDVRVERPGYEPAWHRDVEVVSNECTPLETDLRDVRASLSGVVVDSLSGLPIESVLVTATCAGDGDSWITGPDGTYSLDALVPGDVRVRCTAPGYREKEVTRSLAPTEDADLTVELLEMDGTIAGTVRLDGGEPLAGASVRARLAGEVVSTALTDAGGGFAIGGLDRSALYEVRAGAEGYYCVSQNPLSDVSCGTLDASFTFGRCTGTLSGHVFDETSGEPVEGATVAADDGDGHYAQASTDESGAFALEDLVPERDYLVTASVFGYHDASLTAAPGSQGLALNVPRNFARVDGTISASSPDIDPEDLEVIATNTSYNGGSRVEVPDPDGSYDVIDVRPGSYLISVSGDGCLSTPAQISCGLAEGQTVSGIDFSVEKAVVERVDIGGPSSVPAGGSAVFTADALDSENRVIDVDLEWRVSPASAGTIERSTGVLSVDAGYVGRANVAAAVPGGGTVGRQSFSVYAAIDSSTDATFADSTGMTLRIMPGAVDGAKSVYLSRLRLPEAKRYRRGFEISALSYSLKPTGLAFSETGDAELFIPADDAYDRLVCWNEERLRWADVESETEPGGLRAYIGALGEYGAKRSSEPLGVGNVEVAPNPFSPVNGGVTISYDLSSSDARLPFVTVRVYNMAAQLVREVVENEAQTKGRASVEWDGLTDDREVARNGRYVVEIKAEDASGVETALTTVVLVK